MFSVLLVDMSSCFVSFGYVRWDLTFKVTQGCHRALKTLKTWNSLELPFVALKSLEFSKSYPKALKNLEFCMIISLFKNLALMGCS